uniref:Uncharacterized protein n=2 Tax=Chlamydomonas euryale TaxID=1486919 RepID=A0A7R9VA66_9CHLO|mmetsp:Transcript_28070/g.83161  ORF Transcript_28070/g.83161 Transcript_28070/m.83161 type:complete len:129 (+) Transcript_28070:245-631(+)
MRQLDHLAADGTLTDAQLSDGIRNELGLMKFLTPLVFQTVKWRLARRVHPFGGGAPGGADGDDGDDWHEHGASLPPSPSLASRPASGSLGPTSGDRVPSSSEYGHSASLHRYATMRRALSRRLPSKHG